MENFHVKSSSARWRSSYKYGGANGLQGTRKYNTGSTTTKNLSIEEKYVRLEVQSKLLRIENELIKKLDMIENRVLKRKYNYLLMKNSRYV